MKSLALAVGLTLLLFADPVATQTAPPKAGIAHLTEAQRAEIEKTLTDATMELTTGTNQLSTAALEKYLSSEFYERVGSGNINATGKEAFVKYFTNNTSLRASQKWEKDTIKVHILSPDLAYVVEIGGGYVTFKSGRHGGYGNAITRIWRREAGGWRILHMHESLW